MCSTKITFINELTRRARSASRVNISSQRSSTFAFVHAAAQNNLLERNCARISRYDWATIYYLFLSCHGVFQIVRIFTLNCDGKPIKPEDVHLSQELSKHPSLACGGVIGCEKRDELSLFLTCDPALWKYVSAGRRLGKKRRHHRSRVHAIENRSMLNGDIRRLQLNLFFLSAKQNR